jgi:hypothetical protein
MLVPRALAAPDRSRVVGYLSGGQGPEWLTKRSPSAATRWAATCGSRPAFPPDWESATLAKAAAELVAARPDVLCALMGNRVGALAAATRTIPIVSAGVPIRSGRDSLNRCGARAET